MSSCGGAVIGVVVAIDFFQRGYGRDGAGMLILVRSMLPPPTPTPVPNPTPTPTPSAPTSWPFLIVALFAAIFGHQPNAIARIVNLDASTKKIIIVAKRNIKPGEEVSEPAFAFAVTACIAVVPIFAAIAVEVFSKRIFRNSLHIAHNGKLPAGYAETSATK